MSETPLLKDLASYTESSDLPTSLDQPVRTPSDSQDTSDVVSSSPQYNLLRILPALWIGTFLCALDGTIVANTMASIASSFEQEHMVSWVATLYLLTNTAFQPLYGRVSDIVGRKPALLFAQFWFGLGCILCCFARSVPQFAIARGIAGVGGGGLPALLSIIVSDMVSLQERGLYQGYSGIVFCVGQVLGGPLGGLLVQTIGWRWMFAVQVPLVIVCFILCYLYVNIELHHEAGTKDKFSRENLRRIDVGGALSLVTAITSVLFLLSSKLPQFTVIVLSLLLLVSLAAFIYIERSAAEPIIPPHLFKGSLGLTALMAGFGTMALYSGLFMVPMYLQVTQDFTQTQSGGLIAFAVVATAIGPLIVGKALNTSAGASPEDADHATMLQAKRIALWSVFLEIIGALILVITEFSLPVHFPGHGAMPLSGKAFLALGLILCGFGFGSFLLALLIFVIAKVGKRGQAPATGMNYLFRAVGSVVGVAIALSVYNALVVPRLETYLTGVHGGKKVMKRLLKDTGYLKTGGLSQKVRTDLTEIYKFALAGALVPGVVFAALACVCGVALYWC
ncbi:hypothetical protein BABINDRAFT_160429 [Babjeviella inositovora NRRL Y-12698]|uniref:Major facilitator superfamily (MFS) profile domain-containing protein n=1 Tax=Babjeviella inositovora NRRL Y-12698 TaxID=984486 RepID=A0A1E3QTJ7_9ASCO|nr:uncharacterized protein BABINDRAFT_160429 [Babjeviella inositovora NRRL Y-12698]ODQ81009.1 hypothetical protein BABINDRAFT_160429 [Babjeviella inositovora NRRL Y-12698]